MTRPTSSQRLDIEPHSLVRQLLVDPPQDKKGEHEDQIPRERPAITRVAPPSALLSRLSSFLPQLAQANDELFNAIQESGDVEAFNIESVDDESPYIEMNLGLGVFEEKRPDDEDTLTTLSLPGASSSPLDSSLLIQEEESEEDSEENDEDSDEDSEEDSDEDSDEDNDEDSDEEMEE